MKLNIVFMGTPEFAVPALEALIQSPHTVGLVVTQPDRPRGRGRKLAMPPVKQVALEADLEVLQPDSVRKPEVIAEIRDLQPDIMVVVAFSHILPQELIQLPPLGIINIHPSLLPKYRGPAPIQWALINGEQETGVTIMQMDEGMDSGDVLMVRREPIKASDTAGSLHDRLAGIGAALLMETLQGLCEKTITPTPQTHAEATYVPLLKKADGLIDWGQTSRRIDCFIRGMHPWPGAHTFHGKQRLKILQAKPLDAEVQAPAGSVVQGFTGELRVATGQGLLLIEKIQGPSGKRLPAADFLRGYPLEPGDQLGTTSK